VSLTVGSLFSGIGGFDLGLERAGMRVVWQCEQDPFCRRVLARHWPGVPCHPDVRALVADTADAEPQVAASDDAEHGQRSTERRRAVVTAGARTGGRDCDGRDAARDGRPAREVPVPVPHVDVLCGGFPCQDISLAGRGAGLAGERSGLWREFARIIGELRPRYVIVENVPALTVRGLDVVLADLAACGFDAEWDHLPASAFGAPHRRDRIWLVAYPAGQPEREPADQTDAIATRGQARDEPRNGGASHEGRPLDDALRGRHRPSEGQLRAGRDSPLDAGRREPQSGLGVLADGLPTGLGGHWDREPHIGRVAVNVPQRVDKLRALGNALVPQIAEWVGRQIIEWEAQCLV
jgi:DNA (cytosine-5)-methyltransferase 1